MLPLVEELTDVPSIETALDAFSEWPDLILFESALKRDGLGRYSFLSGNPLVTCSVQDAEFGSDPFEALRDFLSRPDFQIDPVEGLPPFQGGVAGLLSYELGGCFEKLPQAQWNEFQMPSLHAGLYDWVLAWDHLQDRAWVICHWWVTPRRHRAPKNDGRAGARHRMAQVLRQLDAPDTPFVPDEMSRDAGAKPWRASGKTIAPDRLAPQFPIEGCPGVTSDFSRDDYLTAVQRVRDYIYAGDIFQANLSQRLLIESQDSPLDIYRRLRKCNAAPFASYFQHDDWAIVSASPERFIKLDGGTVTTRPIKGTRQRRTGAEADLFSRDELRQSEKDVAENVMIVDLLRNDLSRVCEPGSVTVPQLCTVETYETVQHLVSEVRGQLPITLTPDQANRSADLPGRFWSPPTRLWDLLRATFPGGSITGAPKVRAMEIIAELEPTARGPYCGSLFYAGFDGTFDSSILIRTFVCRHGQVQCSVGGGIVAQSDPVREYEETLHKAEGMLRAFGHARRPK